MIRRVNPYNNNLGEQIRLSFPNFLREGIVQYLNVRNSSTLVDSLPSFIQSNFPIFVNLTNSINNTIASKLENQYQGFLKIELLFNITGLINKWYFIYSSRVCDAIAGS